MTWSNDDILNCFIREFAVSGELSGLHTTDGRRERIRIAVWKSERQTLPFHDSGMTYSQAFQRVFNRPLESRLKPRYDSAILVDETDDEDDITSDTEELETWSK
jgi:hypothetical protein